MNEHKKEDTNPDIVLVLEEVPRKDGQSPAQPKSAVPSPERPMLDLSAIDPTKPLPGVRERRAHPRLEMKGSIQLHTNAQDVVGTTADISAKGIGVRVDDRFQFAAGAILTIEFRPPSGLNGFLAQVEVTRSINSANGKREIGLRIVKCTKLMEQRLIEFIKNAA
jgi:hypothetical protein